jgi:glutamyl/glutaminyl-tRNA synthetase
MPDVVRARFAPSPTGYLHIGGARTALFNYLLARRLGGKFVLRIEDTDQTRNIEAADAKLMEDLRWLGLQWDEGPEIGGPYGPYYQSQRRLLYDEHVRRLLDAGQAYYAMETREELEAMRKAAHAAGEKGFRYRRPTHFPSDAEAQRARDAGRPVVIRFKMPERDFVVPDQILGAVKIGALELSDFVIVKSDGWPTYNFAVVVDDAGMHVTHVLRGQEHLMNTPGQIALFEAFGYTPPAFAHLPIIFNMNGTKMSKREKDKVVREAAKAAHLEDRRIMELAGVEDAGLIAAWRKSDTQLPGAALERLARAIGVHPPEIDIHDFRKSGYLPEVLVNFIALLGWSPGGGERERFTLAELCAEFSVERIGKTNARFDREKLLAFNTAALEAAPMPRKLSGLRDWLSVSEPGPLTALDDGLLTRLVELCRGFRTFPDIEYKAGRLFVPDEAIQYDPAALKQWLLKGDQLGVKVLREIKERLAALAEWSPAKLDELIRGFADERGLGLGKVAQPLRVAVTGTTVSPQIAETLALLGRERTLTRIARVLAVAAPAAG